METARTNTGPDAPRTKWSAAVETVTDGSGLRYSVTLSDAIVSYREVLHRWQQDADFRAFFNDLLANSPFAAFRWETPAIATRTADRPFEFVLLDDPGLARTPDPETFASHFRGPAAEKGVVEFPNLRKDAMLIVPSPMAPHSSYGHVGAFVRTAPDSQRHAL